MGKPWPGGFYFKTISVKKVRGVGHTCYFIVFLMIFQLSTEPTNTCEQNEKIENIQIQDNCTHVSGREGFWFLIISVEKIRG